MSNYGIELKSKNEIFLMSCSERVCYYQALQIKWSRFKPFDEISRLRKIRMLEAIDIRFKTVVSERELEIQKEVEFNSRMNRIEIQRIKMNLVLEKMHFDIKVCLEKIILLTEKQEDALIDNFHELVSKVPESVPIQIVSDEVSLDYDVSVLLNNEDCFNERDYDSPDQISNGNFFLVPSPLYLFYRGSSENKEKGIVYGYDNIGCFVKVSTICFGQSYYTHLLKKKKFVFRVHDYRGQDVTLHCLEICSFLRDEDDVYVCFRIKEDIGFPFYLLIVDGYDRSKVDSLLVCPLEKDKNVTSEDSGGLPLSFKPLGYSEACSDYSQYLRCCFSRKVDNASDYSFFFVSSFLF